MSGFDATNERSNGEPVSDASTFSVGDRPRVLASGGAADVSVTVGAPGNVEIAFPMGGAENFRIQQRGDRITVRPLDRTRLRGHVTIELVVPSGTDLKLSTASGYVETMGPVGDLDVAVASGDISVNGAAGAVRIKSASGDVDVVESADLVDVTTVSGDVRLGVTLGSVSVATASGDVRIASVEDICSVNSVSGDVSVQRCDATDFAVRTMSGDVVLGLASQRKVDLDFESVAGDLRNEISSGASAGPPQGTISLRCRSVSGDLTLRSS